MFESIIVFIILAVVYFIVWGLGYLMLIDGSKILNGIWNGWIVIAYLCVIIPLTMEEGSDAAQLIFNWGAVLSLLTLPFLMMISLVALSSSEKD